MNFRQAVAYMLPRIVSPENMLKAYNTAADHQVRRIVKREISASTVAFDNQVNDLSVQTADHISKIVEETKATLNSFVANKAGYLIGTYLKSGEFERYVRVRLSEVFAEQINIAYPVLVFDANEFEDYKNRSNSVEGPITKVIVEVDSEMWYDHNIASSKMKALMKLKEEAKKNGVNLVKIVKITDAKDQPLDFDELKDDPERCVTGLYYTAELFRDTEIRPFSTLPKKSSQSK